MENVDNKPFMVKEQLDGSDELKINISGVVMPDGSTLEDTIIKLQNKIDALQKEVNELKNK